ncbi:MAG TPA: hypothetical protein VKT21_03005 [Thermoplasmata archaeon]|nr:hypothetical protein [Thermoplasmata archaeon]
MSINRWKLAFFVLSAFDFVAGFGVVFVMRDLLAANAIFSDPSDVLYSPGECESAHDQAEVLTRLVGRSRMPKARIVAVLESSGTEFIDRSGDLEVGDLTLRFDGRGQVIGTGRDEAEEER